MEYLVRRAEDLGSAIAEFRTIRGLTQTELAEQLALHRTYVSKLESGEPTAALKRLWAACAALGLDIVVRDRPQ